MECWSFGVMLDSINSSIHSIPVQNRNYNTILIEEIDNSPP